MAAVSPRLTAFLEQSRTPFQKIHHTPDFTSQETAAHTNTRGREFAKTVVLRVDNQFALAVLPAHHRVDVEALRRWLNAQDIRLATEEEMRDLFPDCEVGAEPPMGALYEMPVYVSPILAGDEEITFNAGSHEDAIRMKYDDFARLNRPSIIHLSSS